LELGGGSGDLAESILFYNNNITQYHVSDISNSRVNLIKKRFTKDLRGKAHLFSAEQIPSNRGPFDAVVMIALIKHLVDPLEAMKRVNKIVKPGGIVFIMTPNIARYMQRVKLLFERFPSTASKQEGFVTYVGKPVSLHDEGHLHYFTFNSLSRMLLEMFGFSEVSTIPLPDGNRVLGDFIHWHLSKLYPSMFSELCIVVKK